MPTYSIKLDCVLNYVINEYLDEIRENEYPIAPGHLEKKLSKILTKLAHPSEDEFAVDPSSLTSVIYSRFQGWINEPNILDPDLEKSKEIQDFILASILKYLKIYHERLGEERKEYANLAKQDEPKRAEMLADKLQKINNRIDKELVAFAYPIRQEMSEGKKKQVGEVNLELKNIRDEQYRIKYELEKLKLECSVNVVLFGTDHKEIVENYRAQLKKFHDQLADLTKSTMLIHQKQSREPSTDLHKLVIYKMLSKEEADEFSYTTLNSIYAFYAEVYALYKTQKQNFQGALSGEKLREYCNGVLPKDYYKLFRAARDFYKDDQIKGIRELAAISDARITDYLRPEVILFFFHII